MSEVLLYGNYLAVGDSVEQAREDGASSSGDDGTRNTVTSRVWP